MTQDMRGASGARFYGPSCFACAPSFRRCFNLKSAAKQRSAEVLADFENQMGQHFSFNQDEVWAEASKVAMAAVAKANEQIKARCREIGIPDRFAPADRLAI